MKILVTGANGYLGQGIVKELLVEGNEVVATDLSIENIDERATRITSNIFDLEDPGSVFGKVDVLLHLAWRDGFVHYSKSHIEDLPKHFAFVTQMIDAGVEHVAVMGSMHEVGFFEGSIDEKTPCNPITPYGIGKNALRELTEMLCKQKGIIFQWLRGYYIVGNSQTGSSIFSKIASAEGKGEKLFPFTYGQNQYDFLDYCDFCEEVVAAVTQNKINGVINICSGRPEKLADRVERFIKENDYVIELQYGAFPDRPYDSKAIWGNSEKIDRIMFEKKRP